MPAIRAVAGACFFLLASCGSLRASIVPDWVHQAASQTLPGYAPDTNAVVLLDEESDNVTAPGEYTEHHRRVVKILRPDGRHEGYFHVELGQKEKLLSLHAWTVDKTGREYELKEKDFADRSFPTFILYDDIHYRTANAPASDPGSVIAIEYEARRQSYSNQTYWFLQSDIPVRETSLTVQLPPGWEFKDSWAATTAVKPTGVGENSWKWTKRDLPGIESEPRMPYSGALSERMAVAFFPPSRSKYEASWDGIARWYAALAVNRRAPTPEIISKVREMTSGKTDFDSKLRAIAGFMQSEIRYVAIEIAIGGFQPHPASEVFHYRYGDCKDKATLLSSMLQEAGIRSEFVLVDTRRGMVDPALPSPYFDHAILAIELPDAIQAKAYQSVITAKSGKLYLIFDPTDEVTPLGTLRGELQDTYALLVTDSGGEMIHTPLMPPVTNLVARTGRFTLAADGTLSGEISETRGGDSAASSRAMLLYSTEKERTEHFERALGDSLKGFSLHDTSIEHLNDLQENLRLKLMFTAPGYGQVRGPLMLVPARVFGQNSLNLEHGKPRKYPVVFDSTIQETDNFEIDLPPGYTVDDLPEPTKVDAGFASFQSKFEVTGSQLRYSREYVRREVKIDPARFSELRKFEERLGADEMAAVVLKKVP